MADSGREVRRIGGALLVAVLAANFLCGAALLVRLRAQLTEELEFAEHARVSAKVNAYLSGKMLLFSSITAGGWRTLAGEERLPGETPRFEIVRTLPADWDFRRVRSRADGVLPLFLGRPRPVEGEGMVLPIARLYAAPGGAARYAIGRIPLSDLEGYFADLRQRGILCRMVDEQGQTLLGEARGLEASEAMLRPGARSSPTEWLSPAWRTEVAIPATARRLPLLSQVLLALLIFLNAATLVYLRKKYLRPQEAALQRMVHFLARRGVRLRPERNGLPDVADAVEDLLGREPWDTPEALRKEAEARNRRMDEIEQAHKDLLAHHKLTKKMLRSREVDEVFETFLNGVAEGCGFRGALLGRIAKDGCIVFPGETDPVTGKPVRIPLWNPGSLLARVFWSGNHVLSLAPAEVPHLPEEEAFLLETAGEQPLLLVPLMRNLKTHCAEIRNCGGRPCPQFFSDDNRCWLRHVNTDGFIMGADPERFREPLLRCLSCEMFPASAILLVRTGPGGKALNRDSVAPVLSLAEEAKLALEVVSLYNNMRLMAITDGLTGLFNHREFYSALRRELERARRYRHALSLLIIDVDDFKAFNDRFGHPAGDYALRKVGEVLRRCARATDVVARYGGEEFAVILAETIPKGASMVAERIKIEMGRTNFIQDDNKPFHLSVSIGVFTTNDGAVSEDQMVAFADEAAYRAKLDGKNRVVVRVPT